MNLSKKIALIVSAVCIVTGIACVVAALSLDGFSFLVDGIGHKNLESIRYDITEPFLHIEVEELDANVRLLPSENGTCRVDCTIDTGFSYTVAVEKETLTISFVDQRKWYERIGILANRELDIYLPEQTYVNLYLHTISGEIRVPDTFTFFRATLESTSGDITFEAVTENGLKIRTTSGDVLATGGKGGNVDMGTTSGDIHVSNTFPEKLSVHSISGDVALNKVAVDSLATVATTSGEIRLSQCDAGTFDLSSVSGDVKGDLLSVKNFAVSTVSGDISIPSSDPSAGHCTVSTTSGDVKLALAE